MKKILLFAALLVSAAFAYGQNCSDLFFSEYLEGSGNNKGMEIYNPTPDVINLSSYYIARYSNGKNTYIDGGITQLEGFLQGYGTHLIVNGQTTSTETSPASDPNLRAIAQQLDHDYPAPTYMNGNDAIALFKDLGGSGDPNDFMVLDLFGIIGGGMTSDDEGWASVTDVWFYRNVYEGEVLVGKDSALINNYIVPEGYYFYKYDLWSANHSLVRKPGVKKGVSIETIPTEYFDVTMEWDTVPGGQDVWDSLNTHYCDCQYASAVSERESKNRFHVYPNPSEGMVTIASEDGVYAIDLIDMAGRKVRSYENLDGVLVRRIDLESIPTGIYLIQMKGDSYTEIKKLVIKN